MGGKWWCFGNDDDDDEVSDLDPVLLVSGIGGSILNSESKSWFGLITTTTRVWVRILLADLEFRKRVWSLYNPQTGYTEELDDSSDIVVPDDDYGLYAIDILDPSFWIKLLHITDVYHFHDMIDMLIGCGYKKGTTLFGYGYDFRQSNRIDKAMDGLKERLETAYEAAGGRKVNLISHSMGGLLVSCFISLHSDVCHTSNDLFSTYSYDYMNLNFILHEENDMCRLAIGVCQMVKGAPGCINDSLLTGLQFVEGLESYFFVSRWSMHQLLVECPSIYEMLPNPEFNWKKQPEIIVWRNRSENGQDTVKMERYGTSGSVGLFVEALKDNEIEYNKKTIPLPFNYDIYQWAATTRKMLNSVRLPEGISFYNIYGTSLETPFDVWYVVKP
ncbi:lecithin:cholesterol/phospholipid:diacylglycerol acyltransferase [Artemisia annua]|uniref:Lecithin:cholesterol/phospholipid:diacylglycerol acyltransferase n=1 Tax=Artemisia annua TaxID=35608 RepID=A0A2U1KMC4_ARTAN|nr:lecithin:cholesterol/phospholipid:diacylglycerol acyltransferase [Artemisia annua]